MVTLCVKSKTSIHWLLIGAIKRVNIAGARSVFKARIYVDLSAFQLVATKTSVLYCFMQSTKTSEKQI
jgi:hypothetical protein